MSNYIMERLPRSLRGVTNNHLKYFALGLNNSRALGELLRRSINRGGPQMSLSNFKKKLINNHFSQPAVFPDPALPRYLNNVPNANLKKYVIKYNNKRALDELLRRRFILGLPVMTPNNYKRTLISG